MPFFLVADVNANTLAHTLHYLHPNEFNVERITRDHIILARPSVMKDGSVVLQSYKVCYDVERLTIPKNTKFALHDDLLFTLLYSLPNLKHVAFGTMIRCKDDSFGFHFRETRKLKSVHLMYDDFNANKLISMCDNCPSIRDIVVWKDVGVPHYILGRKWLMQIVVYVIHVGVSLRAWFLLDIKTVVLNIIVACMGARVIFSASQCIVRLLCGMSCGMN